MVLEPWSWCWFLLILGSLPWGPPLRLVGKPPEYSLDSHSYFSCDSLACTPGRELNTNTETCTSVYIYTLSCTRTCAQTQTHTAWTNGNTSVLTVAVNSGIWIIFYFSSLLFLEMPALSPPPQCVHISTENILKSCFHMFLCVCIYLKVYI